MVEPGSTCFRELTVGEVIVGVGTLVLAGMTWWLARRTSAEVRLTEQGLALTRESIEAQDRPFLVATPQGWNALDFLPLVDMSDSHLTGPVDLPPEPVLFVQFENWGNGPAICDGVSVRDDNGRELVGNGWKVVPTGPDSRAKVIVSLRNADQVPDTGLLPKDKTSVTVSLANAAGHFPQRGTKLTLRLYYRSASGARYETEHRFAVGDHQDLTRLNFRRALSSID